MAFRTWEWLLRAKLAAGLQAFRDDTTLVPTLFADLSPNSLTNVQDWLMNHEVSILLGYPQHLEDLPAWTIALAGESVITTPLGGLLSHTFDPNTGDETDETGDLIRKTYQIFTASLNPDLTVVLAAILQQILKSMRRELDTEGFHQMTVGQLDPINLRTDFLPQRVYVRTTTVSLMTEETVLEIDTSLPKDVEITLSIDLNL